MEGLIREVFQRRARRGAARRRSRALTYAEAMARYGADKPDLRVPLELTELTDVMKSVEFKVFRQAARAAGRTRRGAARSRRRS